MAKPTPLSIGRANPHVLQSRGADPNIMNFYSTSYSTGFTKPSIEHNKGRSIDIPAYSGNEVFKPRSAPENKQTGYVANVRPQIYYQESLDRYDNPDMGKMLRDNYNTMTHLQFTPYKLNDGTEELPAQVLDQRTAYTQNAYNHNPLPNDVANLYTDSRIKAPYDVLDKHRARLNKINDHDPLTNENYGHGPNYMSTEYATRYETPDRNRNAKLQPAVGPKETSGYTNNDNIREDVLTEVPGQRWLHNNRPTGTSDYKDKYVPFVYPKSANDISLPNVSNIEQTQQSNYAKTFKSGADIYPRKNNFDSISETKDKYTNQQPLNHYLDEKLGSSKVVGPKEIGGQSHSEIGHLSSFDDPRRFITNYQMKHYDMTPKYKDREGYVTGGLNGHFDDAYVVNNKAQNPGIINTSHELKNMDSYQSRSIRANNTFYDDRAHDQRLFQKNKVVTFADNNSYSIKTSS